MPTQPYEPVLNRDMYKDLPKPLQEAVSPLLKEVVNYATNFYQRCQTSKAAEPDEAFPVLASYLHIIQMTDAIEVLVSSVSVEPANLLLRSSFEARLSIEYMLEKNYKERAFSWLTKQIIDQMQQLEDYDQNRPPSKEFKTTVIPDEVRAIVGLPIIPNVSDNILRLKESLKKPGYTEAYAEYTALVKKRVKYPDWYSFYNGPRSLKELAEHLNHGSEYHYLYSSWSKMSHVSSTAHLTALSDDGSSVLGPIRNPKNIVHISTMALSILLETTQLLLNKYRPFETTRFTKWYAKEVQRKHIMLVGLELGELKWLNEKLTQKK